MPMTNEQRAELVDCLAGTCNDLAEVAEKLGIPFEEAGAAMAEEGHERCETCGWWCEDDEIDIVDDEYVCADCREAE